MSSVQELERPSVRPRPSIRWRTGQNPGEPFVWLTSLGLLIGLGMIIFLLSIVMVNGLSVFWPKDVARIELKEGDSRVTAGEIVKVQKKHARAGAHTDAREFQIYTGNREQYGLAFRFIDESNIARTSWPDDLAVIERLENGDVIGVPVAFRLSETESVSAGDERFDLVIGSEMREVQRRWAQIRRIEKGDIGRINAEMERLRLKEKALPKSAGSAKKSEEIRARTAKLQGDFEVLAKQARDLRAKQKEHELIFKLAEGTERVMASGQIANFYYPNRLTFFQKASHFASNLWHFITEEPREANTEGGIFPAIFGTFVMTVIMSVAVVPFGVVAAIYLREYAKHGIMLRTVRIAVNNLAGVPSIVFGVFGLGFFVYTLGGSIDQLFYKDALPTPTFGTGGILWASLTLALMTVPVVIVATEEAIAAVPRGMREGSLACGASKWQTIQRIVLPASAPGILTGLILAMARGAGEVAPLMIVGVVKLAPALPLDAVFPFAHFDRKFMHLGFHIYDLGFQSPDSEAAKPMVFATTLILITLVVLLNLTAFRIRQNLRKKYATSAF